MWGGKTLDPYCFCFQGERVKVKAFAFEASRELIVTCRASQHFKQFGTVQGMTDCLFCSELLFFVLWNTRKWSRQPLTFPLREAFWFAPFITRSAPFLSEEKRH